jgi:hypothetical protein
MKTMTLPNLATSVNVEWIFSKGQILLLHTKNWLNGEGIRAILCLGSWVEAGLIDEESWLAMLKK